MKKAFVYELNTSISFSFNPLCDDDDGNDDDHILRGATPLLEKFLPPGVSLRQVAFSADGQYIAFAYNTG